MLFGPSSLLVAYLVLKYTVLVKKWTSRFTDSNVHVYYINYCNSYPYSLAKSCAVFALPPISFVHFLTFHKYLISAAYVILTRSADHVSISLRTSRTGNDYTRILCNITILFDIPLFQIITLKQISEHTTNTSATTAIPSV